MSARPASGTLSIVIPMFNEEDVLPLMRRRLDAVLAGPLQALRPQVILVDDGSTDRTAELMRALVAADARYQALILSRNYGHQVALTAGLDHATGDAVVVLDADLQDPPELIPEMLARWREGSDVVFGQRTSRTDDSPAKRLTARCFYWLIRHLSGVDIPDNVGDFRLMDKAVVQALRRMPEHFRFVRGLVAWVGFRQVAVAFERAPRAAGVTKYPWKKMFLFAIDAVFAFSAVPIRLATLMGLVFVAIAGEEVLRTLYLRLVSGVTIPGFSAIFIAVLIVGGLNLLFLGIIGEYVGRIYVETKNRPLYVVQEFVSKEPGS
ncbi:MAG: glycosyltransferase family 2 protein [Acidobacteria bacterium]|nr:glycosyltransferase family 2 protein [Acidobacteriota bacterium]